MRMNRIGEVQDLPDEKTATFTQHMQVFKILILILHTIIGTSIMVVN